MESTHRETGEGITPVIQEIYLLLDVSGSMLGAANQSLQSAVDQLFRLLGGLNYRYKHVTFKVITISFAEHAKLLSDQPYDLESYPSGWQWPDVEEHAFTNFGKALKLVTETLESKSASTTGFLSPFFIVVGDGSSSDDWSYELAKFNQLSDESKEQINRWLINLTDHDNPQMYSFLKDEEKSININQLTDLVNSIRFQLKNDKNMVSSSEPDQVDQLEVPSTVF